MRIIRLQRSEPQRPKRRRRAAHAHELVRRRPNFKPVPAVVLAVDAGMHAGVAIHQRGIYVDSGYGDGYDVEFIRAWIANALFFARVLGLPLVLVIEMPPRKGHAHKGRSPLGAGSVIGSRKLWIREWERSEAVNRRVVSPQPQTWRAPIFGTTRETEARERLLACHTKYGVSGLSAAVEPNEAAAICIATWSTYAPQVVGVLPQRLQGHVSREQPLKVAGSAR